jgi:hypothetical protein
MLARPRFVSYVLMTKIGLLYVDPCIHALLQYVPHIVLHDAAVYYADTRI